MVLFEVTSHMPDGSVIIKFKNGYSFEGFVDVKYNPTSGTLTTPTGAKYDIPDFKEDVYAVFNLIEKNKLERYRIKDNNAI